jgi:hypothetical protein
MGPALWTCLHPMRERERVLMDFQRLSSWGRIVLIIL